LQAWTTEVLVTDRTNEPSWIKLHDEGARVEWLRLAIATKFKYPTGAKIVVHPPSDETPLSDNATLSKGSTYHYTAVRNDVLVTDGTNAPFPIAVEHGARVVWLTAAIAKAIGSAAASTWRGWCSACSGV
jgi:hypothetical protein